MKNITLIIAAVYFLLGLAACNAKQEKTIEDETDDIAVSEDYEDFEYEEPDTLKQDSADIKMADSLKEEKTDSTETNKKETDKKEPVLEEKDDGSLSEVSEEKLKAEEKKQKSSPKKQHVKKFYIIAGSFKNINNAVDLRAYLKTKGFPAMVLFPYRGYNRVAVKSFKTRNEAEKEIARVRSMNMNYKDEDLEYWLLWR